MDSIPSPGWQETADEVGRTPGITLIIGDIDAGKSTFTRYLVDAVAAGGSSVGVVDADVGQSALCIPGTVSAALFTAPLADDSYRCARFRFVGTANPVHALNDVLQATAAFVQELRQKAQAVIVDTGGLISGPIGVGFKLAKIRLTQPDRIIALERAGECEEILHNLDEVAVTRLQPSPYVSPRNRTARTAYRRDKILAFMAAAPLMEHLLPETVELVRLGRAAGRSLRAQIPVGTIIGLNHGDESVDIGMVTEAGKHPLIACHLPSLKGIDRIIFGDLVIEETSPESVGLVPVPADMDVNP